MLWGGWWLVLAVFFSSGTFINSYYVAALVPAVAALCGTGIAACGPGPWPARVRMIVAATVLGCVGYGAYLMSGTASGPVVLTVVALVVAAAAAAQVLLPASGKAGHGPVRQLLREPGTGQPAGYPSDRGTYRMMPPRHLPGRSVVRAVDRLLDNGVENHDADSGQDGVPVEAFWESFRLDPRQSGHASMRASDADREIVRAMLADAYADGRLAREEYDDRLNTLYASRTLGEMPSLVTDLVPPDGPPIAPAPPLPADPRTRGARKWRRDVEESFVAFLVPSIICTVIWIAVTGAGFFWPVFPMLFLGLNLVKTIVQRESIIEREVLRLEEQAAKDAAPELPTGRGDTRQGKGEAG